MEFEQQIVLSLVGVLVGFVLSQSVNIVGFLRRPKFAVSNFSEGVLSAYTGDPPETPSDIVLGFYLKNIGYNPAIKTRVFVSDLRSAKRANEPFLDGVFEFSELVRPIDIIPPGEEVMITLGQITSEKPHLNIKFENEQLDELRGFIEAETRGKKSFAAKFLITCESLDSFTAIELQFHPEKDSFATQILNDIFPAANVSEWNPGR